MSILNQPRIYKPSSSGKTEDPERYKPGGLHPVHIGDRFKENRYQIVHKLDFGSFSTNWLAKDLQQQKYFSLKIARANPLLDINELRVLRYLADDRSHIKHPGRQFVMVLMDDFWICGPNGKHQCYVTQVAGRRLNRQENVDASNLESSRILSRQLIEGLAYLNSCSVAHGDLYTSNILMQLANFDSWSQEEIYDCLRHPSKEQVQRLDSLPRESTAPCYCVKRPDLATLERRILINKVLIIDFGQAFCFNQSPTRITTPAQFSAPEVLYRTEISPSIDKWALGCTIFEICAGHTLFKMIFNPRTDVLKDMVAMLGKPPDSLWLLWEDREKYFEPGGQPRSTVGQRIPVQAYPLSERVINIGRPQPAISDRRNSRTEVISENATYSSEQTVSEELEDLKDLLSQMMVYDPEARIALEKALVHPFFSNLSAFRF